MKPSNPINWPHKDYPNAWMAFRRASHENTVIANWVFSQTHWPKKDALKLTDIGCGDGKVIGEILTKHLELKKTVASVFLIEPYKPTLEAAKEDIQQINRSIQIELYAGNLKEAIQAYPDRLFSVDAILCIHVVYLIERDEFANLLEKLPRHVPLYVAFDEPRSVFSQLWKETAKPYLDCVIDAHNTISTLPMDKYQVTKTSLVSEFNRNLVEPNNPQAALLISMLCYKDNVDISESSQFGKYFKKVVDDNTINGNVQCRFTGYQIIKK